MLCYGFACYIFVSADNGRFCGAVAGTINPDDDAPDEQEFRETIIGFKDNYQVIIVMHISNNT